MRVIDCDCGVTLQAGNDDDLVRRVREHLAADHAGAVLDEAAIRALVARRAYAATDS
jgi:predicted small metal-binding protein